MLRNLILNLSITMNLSKALSPIFCNAAKSISAFSLHSASESIRMPMVWFLHSLLLRLHKPGRQKGHPRLSLDNFELYPEIFARWTFYQVPVLQVSGYLLSQVYHREYSDWSRYCYSSFSSQFLFLQKYGKRVVFQNRFIWVAIAFVIVTPTVYYSILKWLENFAYKTDLSW